MKRATIFIHIFILVAMLRGDERQVIARTSPITEETVVAWDSVQLPNWRIHLGIVSFPVLNELQRAKLRMEKLKEDIAELEMRVANEQSTIAAKKAEVEKIQLGKEENHSRSYFLLGFFRREKLVRGHRIVFDEKTLLWGAVKWGKAKPKESDQPNKSKTESK